MPDAKILSFSPAEVLIGPVCVVVFGRPKRISGNIEGFTDHLLFLKSFTLATH
jgi:hypothetical protein